MPADEYKSFGSGALKLKGVSGSKVKKSKKKDKKKESDLEKNLSTGEALSSSSLTKAAVGDEDKKAEEDKQLRRSPSGHAEDGDGGDDAAPTVRQYKTEAERRFEEARRKKLLEMSKDADKRPELLKTHKERVEELNTYLSKLSEHHDMPKIGPG